MVATTAYAVSKDPIVWLPDRGIIIHSCDSAMSVKKEPLRKQRDPNK